jgi:signal transduction histidine kinase
VILVAILPFLVLVYLGLNNYVPAGITLTWWLVILCLLFVVICLGFALLVKYPRTIISIRNYLKDVAEGEVPEVVQLLENESDITAIEQYFNMVIEQMRERVRTIREQREKLILAERQRVMTETICTTSHHLGQPATSIICYLELLRMRSLPDEASDIVENCVSEANRLRYLLAELQSITQYRTEPYVEGETQETFPEVIQFKDYKTRQSVDKMRRSLDQLLSAYESLEGGYPLGTVVEISNGSVGVVKRNNEGKPMKPYVRIIMDENGNHPEEPVEVDLSQKSEARVVGVIGDIPQTT